MKQTKILSWLTAILIFAAILRFIGFKWDSDKLLHPDERFLTMVTTDIKWPTSLYHYFDTANSPLNPENTKHTFFVYGTFPVFLTKIFGDLTGNNTYFSHYLVGRFFSATFDLLTILTLFFMTRSMYGSVTALFAAFFLALTVLNIQHAHFYVVDPFGTFFLVLSFTFLLRYLRTKKALDACFVGCSFGVAVACKINFIFFGMIIAIAFLYTLMKSWKEQKNSSWLSKWFRQHFLNGVYVAFFAFLLFRILQPYAFAEPFSLALNKGWIDDFYTLKQQSTEESTFPPALQWRNRSSLFHIKNLFLWTLGPPLFLLSLFGSIFAIIRSTKTKRWETLLPLVWIVFILGIVAAHFVRSQRYLLPITPFLALYAAYFCTNAFKGNKIATFGKTLLVIGALFWTLAFSQIYLHPHPRVAASRWIHTNLTSRLTFGNEHWDDGLPLSIRGIRDLGRIQQEQLELFNPDTKEKFTKIAEQLERIDYIFLTSNRLYMVLPRLKNYPISKRYYEMLFDGRLGFEKIQEFTNYPRLFGIVFNDDYAEEVFTVYDHPKVLIFKKKKQLSKEEILNLLMQ